MPVMAVNNQNQHEETGDSRSRPRWSAGKKMEAVLRLLRGEPLETLSRELGVEAHRLAAWRDDFLEGGKEALKGQRPDRSGDDRALRQAERKVGQLTMENEILRAAAEKRGHVQGPPPAQARMIVLQATWAELEGGPDEHHRWAGRAPSPDHLRLGGPRQRRDHRGRIAPATRMGLRGWLGELPRVEGGFAVEGCTGWRFVVEELQAAGLAATWPSRPRPAACAAPSGGPRPTVPTPGCCASCSSRAGCPAPGSRRPGSWICGPPCGCARPWSTSGPPGSSASTPRCSITAAPPCPGAAVAGQPRLAGGVALPPASRQLLGSRWARSTGWMPSRPRSTSGCVPGPPVRRRRPGGAGHRAGHHRV